MTSAKAKKIENKQTWIEKMLKLNKPVRQNETVHCANYSSVVCLKCDKCWGTSTKMKERNGTK